MAWGGLGGLGGFTYPARAGTDITSNVVQSDDEFRNMWRDRGAIIEGEIAGLEAQRMSGIDAARANAIAGARKGLTTNAGALGISAADGIRGAAGLVDRYAEMFNDRGNSAPYVMGAVSGLGGDNPTFQRSFLDYARALRTPADTGGLMDDLGQTQANYQAASAERGENQLRQQQAYDITMLGNNAWGGALPASYSDPQFGQITGQKSGGLGGLGGYSSSDVSGAYGGGSGTYNPWSPDTFKGRSPWGGF